MDQTPRIIVPPPGPRSITLHERLKRLVGTPGRSELYGVSLRRGQGPYMEDLDGNVYLDCLAAASANILGYDREDVVEAYASAARAMQHAGFLYSANEQALALAERLIEISPGEFGKRVVFGMSGSDACDFSLEATRRHSGNLGIIHFRNAYHGTTGLSQPASCFSDLNKGIYPDSPLFTAVDYPVDAATAEQTLERVDDLLGRHRAGGILTEAIQGDAGVKVPHPGFFGRLAEIVRRHDGVLILDEIQSGMGRTGQWWAIEHEGVEPDLLITAKGLSAGYAPISAVVGREDIVEAMDPGQHVFTYAGHAPSAAVALRVLQVVEQEGLARRAAENGAALLGRLEALVDAHPRTLRQARGRGLMIGLEVDTSVDALAGVVFATRCVELGCYVGYFGVNREVVRIEPPLIIGEREVAIMVDTMDQVAGEMDSGQIPAATYDNVRKYGTGL